VEPTELFVEVLRGATELPEELRARAPGVRGCEESPFDESYLAFLDEMIHLSPRGPEWTERLRRRRAGLAPFCGVRLVSGHLRVGTSDFWVKIDPRTRRVVYWEEYRGCYRAADPTAAPDPAGM
jgi:hypothetical protein